MTVLQNCTASNYGTGLIPTLLSNVDRTGCNYVQGAYQELARDLTAGGAGTSIASLLLILYVIFWAFGVWSGTATGSATDAAFRLFRAFVIYTLATSWSDFVSFAYTLFNDGPSAIGNRLLAVGNNNTYTSPNAVVSALENIWNQISQAYPGARRLQSVFLGRLSRRHRLRHHHRSLPGRRDLHDHPLESVPVASARASRR